MHPTVLLLFVAGTSLPSRYLATTGWLNLEISKVMEMIYEADSVKTYKRLVQVFKNVI
jgi:hypothetical protein